MQEVPGLPNREARMSRTKNCDSGGQPDALTYSRVSTHEQADKGTSLKTQTAENLVKAQRLGWRVLPEHVIEEDCSGKDLGRDGIRQILEIAASEKPHGVVIHTLDRLYRPENNGDEWRVFELLHRLEALGLEVVWVDETIPSEGEFSSVFMFLDSWRSGRERRQMVERSVRGKREKARRGKVVNPHSLPKWLRYDRSREQVELDEEWAQVGRLLFHLVGEEGLTLRGASRHFRTLGIRSPSGDPVWQATTIRNWLANPAAKGEYHQLRYESNGQTKSGGKGRRERPVEEHFVLKVPPLVSEELWEGVQRRLQRNKALASRNTRREYLLRGLVICRQCSKHMSGSTFHGYSYYRCGRRGKKKMYLESCTGPLVRADWLGSTVWETITDLLQQPRRREEDSPTRAIAEQELGIAKRRHAEIPEEQDRLVEGYGKGLIPDRLMEPRMRTLQAELEELVERISELEGRLSRLELTEEQEAQALRFAERVQQGLTT